MYKRQIEMCEKLGKRGDVFLPRQFSNEDNTETHYLYTGEMCIRDSSKRGRKKGGADQMVQKRSGRDSL